MKNIYLIIFAAALSTVTFGQRSFNKPPNNPFQTFFSEINILSADSLFNVYYSYRIPYNRIVFEKVDSYYKAGYSISVEVEDSNSNFVTRQLDEKRIKVDSFEETNSDDLYAEGLMNFKIKKGNYNLIPVFTDINSNIEMKSREIILYPDKFSSKNYNQPLIINSNKYLCDGEEKYEVTNFGGSIPFDENNYKIILPITDTSISRLKVVMLNNKDTVSISEIDKYYRSSLSINQCGDKIILNNSNDKFQTNNFILEDFSNKLFEGDLTLIVSNENIKNSKRVFNLNVRWFNKPISLTDPEFAIKALKYADDKKVIDGMLDEKDDDYPKVLLNIGQKMIPLQIQLTIL